MALIHKFVQDNIKLLLDCNSGALHIIDDLIYEVLDYYKTVDKYNIVEKLSDRYSSTEVLDAVSELEHLEREGLLFTEDPYENIVFDNSENSYIKAMCLNIAHDCNLRCKYCFAAEGAYSGSRGLMSEEVGKSAVDLIIKHSGPRKHIEVDLFGGEPLMNYNVVKSVVEYGKSEGIKHNKELRFTITTNATLLNDEIMNFLNDNMTNIVLSIDGRKIVNDKIRIKRNGNGTFDDILPKIKKMVDKRTDGKQYYVRGTFTSQNLDFYNDVIELANNGFGEISIEPVVLPEENELSLNDEHLEVIFEQYDKLAKEIITRGSSGNSFKFYHFAIDLDGGPCVYKRISGCGAGFEYIAVTPEGDIYPCHQFVGNENYKMGTVFEGILNNSIISMFENSHVYKKEECRNCWAKFYCSGGCQANNYNFNGDILKPYKFGCKLQKKRLECALAIKASQFLYKDSQ